LTRVPITLRLRQKISKGIKAKGMPKESTTWLRAHFKTSVRACKVEEYGAGMAQTDPTYLLLLTHIVSDAPGFEMRS
jgi:hypothetical protein